MPLLIMCSVLVVYFAIIAYAMTGRTLDGLWFLWSLSGISLLGACAIVVCVKLGVG